MVLQVINQITEINSGECLRTFDSHLFSFCVEILSYVIILSGFIDKTIQIWNVQNDKNK